MFLFRKHGIVKSELQIESLSRPVTLVNLRRRVVASIHFNNVEFFLEKMNESEPGACFSKDPVTTGPDNLPGRLTGNFTGSGTAFLEATVNFPDTYRPR